MAHGYPAYGNVRRSTVFGQEISQAELAARLGSIDTYDRRGEVAWFDDFEAGLGAWKTDFAGTGGAVARSTVLPRNGAYAVLLTAGSTETRWAVIEHTLSLFRAGHVGFEVSFSPNTYVAYVDVYVDWNDGSLFHTFIVRYAVVEQELQYLTSDSSYVTFAENLVLFDDMPGFHTAKLVVDSAALLYSRFLLDDVEYSLTGLVPPTSVSTEAPYLNVGVSIFSQVGVNGTVFVDDVIVTQNEP